MDLGINNLKLNRSELVYYILEGYGQWHHYNSKKYNGMKFKISDKNVTNI